MTDQRIHNFNAGPAALPLEVLQQAQQELINFDDTGMSIMEHSHRGESYEKVHHEAISLVRRLLDVNDDYEVLFLQGGASLQFAMVPSNLLKPERRANYILTGSWSEKAKKEADILGDTYSGASGENDQYKKIPAVADIKTAADDAYIHMTSNNTIYGTQWQDLNSLAHWRSPVVADMSSDIFSRPVPVNNFDLIYAGAQKNLGPSGVTLVIISKELLRESEEISANIPKILRYQTHADTKSLYHTPPTFAVYMMKQVLAWLEGRGGMNKIAKDNKEKAHLLYSAIDGSAGFYQGHAESSSRSLMNVTFTLPTEELTQKFLTEAKNRGFSGLNGHRSVGGCRASTYNNVPYEACEALREFMISFKNKHS